MVSDIIIEDFSNPTHPWKARNDGQGGDDEGTAVVWIEHGVGTLDGQVQLDTSFAMETRGGVYPDISSCQGLTLKLKRTELSSSSYGYRVSFGSTHETHGYQADLKAAPWNNNNNINAWEEVFVPFSDFSKWDEGNAMVTTTTTTCAQDAQFCPTTDSLQHLERFAVGVQQGGVAGDDKVHLEIASISGTHCTAAEATEQRREETWSVSSSAKHRAATTWVMGSWAGCVLLTALFFVKKRRQAQSNRYSSVHREEDEEHDDTELTLQVWNNDGSHKLEMEELEWLEDNA